MKVDIQELRELQKKGFAKFIYCPMLLGGLHKLAGITANAFIKNKNEFGHAGFFWIKNENILKDLKNFSFKSKLKREVLLDDYFKFLFDKKICKVKCFKVDNYVHIGSIKEYQELKYWENYFYDEDTQYN